MPLLVMRDISKAFNGVAVLKNVSLEVEQGEVHALLGENGAGKSTLMNILTGNLPADSGSIVFEGHTVQKLSVSATEKLGIAFVHQELNLFNDLRVFENVFINREYTGLFGHLQKGRMIEECRKFFKSLDIDINPQAMVSELKTSQKQLLEISKALFFKAKLLILDEPTTSLNNEEVEHLFSLVKSLCSKGISFIFISHKMPEIFAYSDRYTILRNGEFVAKGLIKDTTPEAVTAKMVGKSQAQEDTYQKREYGEPVLIIKNYSGDGFANINLEARKGQIIGMTGLQGSGGSELLNSIFGHGTPTSGYVEVGGKRLKGASISEAMQHGIALLPTNRKENSVIPDMTILENFYLAEHTLSWKDFPVHKSLEEKRYQGFKQSLNIKAESPDLSILSLSGGNQQKIFIARWLNTGAEVLLFDNPTQGIDVGAKAEIYRLILELARSGKTILVNTIEIPELQKVADICAVFFKGRIVKVLPHEEIEEHKVMLYATNSLPAEEQ